MGGRLVFGIIDNEALGAFFRLLFALLNAKGVEVWDNTMGEGISNSSHLTDQGLDMSSSSLVVI